MKRRNFLHRLGVSATALSAGLVPSVQAASASTPSRRPNVLILQPDQHSAFILGCAGHGQVQTPHLNQLATESTYFTRAVANSPVCSPCRASIQSGLYWHTHGVDANGVRLWTGFPCLAEVFQAGGYHTGYIGKWHLDGGDPSDNPGGYIPTGPRRQGWREWWGYERNHEYFDVFRYNTAGEKVRVPGYDWEPAWHTDMTLDFIQRHREEAQPWCFYASYGPPHKPNQCPREFLDRYDPESFTLSPAQKRNFPDEARLRQELRVYYAQVTAIDHEIGRILRGIEEMRVADNTIVLYCSDHGDVLGSHGKLRGKWKPYATAFRVPTMIRWPGRVRAQRTEALIGSPDLPATIVDLAGLSAPISWQGRSMAPHCRGESQELHDALPMGMRGWDGVYDGRYIYSEGGEHVLYDHHTDPHELHNLIQDSPTLAAKMKRRLGEVMMQTGHPDGSRFSG